MSMQLPTSSIGRKECEKDGLGLGCYRAWWQCEPGWRWLGGGMLSVQATNLLSNHLLIFRQSCEPRTLGEKLLSCSVTMEPQKFNLCWNEFSVAASVTLKQLVGDTHFTDVTLSCDSEDQHLQVGKHCRCLDIWTIDI